MCAKTSATSRLPLRAQTCASVSSGLNPQLLKDDPLLFQKPSAGRQFKVTIGSEGARLNINYVLLTKHREILVLRNIKNQSYEDIAAILGISVGTVKSRIARARESLRSKLGEDFKI